MALVSSPCFSQKRKATLANGHEYVDLGLPSGTCWATCNVGAYTPSDFGVYFRWSQTTPAALSNPDIIPGLKDMGEISGNAEYDAATAAWRGPWRTPTREEWEELIRCCNWQYVSQQSHEGLYAIGPSGGAVFFPGMSKAFFCADGTDIRDITSEINMTNGMVTRIGVDPAEYMLLYWSASPMPEAGGTAYCFMGDISKPEIFKSVEGMEIGMTLPIRPVVDGSVVYDDGFVSDEMSEMEKHPYVKSFVNRSTGTLAGHDYVDLGLPSGTMWASCNIGADSPSEGGNFYAWGEDEVKRNYFLEDESKVYGLVYKDISGSDDLDAARRLWGDQWRMPTEYEMQELIDKCNWTWSMVGGKYGYIVEGKSGNSIFIPAAGCRKGRKNTGVGTDGCLWTSTTWNYFMFPADSPSKNRSSYLSFSNRTTGPLGIMEIERETGMSVRPVFSPEIKNKGKHIEEGDVIINSEPQGAYVVVDHRYVDRTPFVASELPQGNHSVFLYLPNHCPVQDYFFKRRGEKKTLTYTLPEPIPGKNSIKVSCLPESAEVYIDGRLEGYTPCIIRDVEDGTHSVNIYKDGYEPKNYFVLLYNGETVLNDTLQKIEDGQVFVDLGLPSGTLWAARNVGAKGMSEFGKAVPTKELVYYAEDIHLVVREDRLCDDCVPSWAQWCELRNECTWRYVFIGENTGYVVVGPNGRAIFLPACPLFLTSDVEKTGTTQTTSAHITKIQNNANEIVAEISVPIETTHHYMFKYWRPFLSPNKEYVFMRAVLNPKK